MKPNKCKFIFTLFVDMILKFPRGFPSTVWFTKVILLDTLSESERHII